MRQLPFQTQTVQSVAPSPFAPKSLMSKFLPGNDGGTIRCSTEDIACHPADVSACAYISKERVKAEEYKDETGSTCPVDRPHFWRFHFRIHGISSHFTKSIFLTESLTSALKNYKIDAGRQMRCIKADEVDLSRLCAPGKKPGQYLVRVYSVHERPPFLVRHGELKDRRRIKRIRIILRQHYTESEPALHDRRR